jgi:hypothetical protein
MQKIVGSAAQAEALDVAPQKWPPGEAARKRRP